MNDLSLEQKDAAVFEKRHWVRLTKVCNNRCMFCLDTGAQDGTVVPEDLVRQKIVDGKKNGAQRLILSGGEPTLHKKFTDFVAFGKKIGYSWVQVVSNGRMFSYPKFVVRAVKSGLDEATISMHGHTAKLHDKLVGIPGAFKQSVQGIKNLLALKRVVSVDIVLNKINLPYLYDMLQFFMDLGIYEFDILHLIPFGRAFDEYFEELAYDLEFAAPYLKKALKLKDTPGLVLWTNRLPISFLEGAEELVQDPHKIYDEVLGEREAFKILVKENKEPECLGLRCPYCPIKGFCDFARAYVHRFFDGNFRLAEITKPLFDQKDDLVKRILKTQQITHLWIKNADLGFLHEVHDGMVSKKYSMLWTSSPEQAIKHLKDKLPVILRLDKNTIGLALSMKWPEHGELILEYPLFERLSEQVELGPDLKQFHDFAVKINAKVKNNLPMCLTQELKIYIEQPVLNLDLLTDDGYINLEKLVGIYIKQENFTKSARCLDCKLNDTCKGLQMNIARQVGLKILKPIVNR